MLRFSVLNVTRMKKERHLIVLHWSTPYSPMPSVDPPAKWTNVGNQSEQCISSLDTVPRSFLGISGPETKARFLVPPSNNVPMYPRLGKLLLNVGIPPLSVSRDASTDFDLHKCRIYVAMHM